jgi:hypothetical protein
LLHIKDVLLSHAAKETVLLIIDEAHYLSIDILEELQLLTNFEYAEEITAHYPLLDNYNSRRLASRADGIEPAHRIEFIVSAPGCL